MDAVEFLKAYNRMCDNVICDKCDLYDKDILGCEITKDHVNAEETVAKVGKWAKANPVRTRQSEFLKQYPGAKLDNDILAVCPMMVSANYRDQYGACAMLYEYCRDCRLEFWMQEVD